jgi:heterodisulfide reductase subunit C
MAKGNQTCKILKEIRKQIAAENDIKLVVEECTYQGDCRGTCPKCEAEVRYLERELEKRQRKGKAAVVAGLSVGLLGASQVALAQAPDTIP